MEESCLVCNRSYETKMPSTHALLVRFVLHACPSCADAMLEQFPQYYDFPTELREDILDDMQDGWLKPIFNKDGELVRFSYTEMPLFLR